MYYGQPYNQSQGYGYNQPYQPYNGQDQLIMVSADEMAVYEYMKDCEAEALAKAKEFQDIYKEM